MAPLQPESTCSLSGHISASRGQRQGNGRETLCQELHFLVLYVSSVEVGKGFQTTGWSLVRMVTVAVGGHGQPLFWEALRSWC